MSSEHSTLGSRILGINRNNDVIPLQKTNMASSWQKCGEKERHFLKKRTHFTVNSQQKEQKRLFSSVRSQKNVWKLITMNITQKIQTFAHYFTFSK